MVRRVQQRGLQPPARLALELDERRARPGVVVLEAVGLRDLAGRQQVGPGDEVVGGIVVRLGTVDEDIGVVGHPQTPDHLVDEDQALHGLPPRGAELARYGAGVTTLFAPLAVQRQVQRLARVDRLLVGVKVDDPVNYRLGGAVGQAYRGRPGRTDHPDVVVVVEQDRGVIDDPAADAVRWQQVGRDIVVEVREVSGEVRRDVGQLDRVYVVGPVVLAVEVQQVAARSRGARP